MRTVPLRDVAEVIRGVAYDKTQARSEPAEDLLPILRAGNIQSDLVADRDLVYVPKTVISARQHLRKDDIVICMSSGSADVVGKVAMSKGDWEGSFGAFCGVIRPEPSRVCPPFLFHMLRMPVFRSWTTKSLGANIKNIRKSELEDFPLELPPLDEQRRIAAILDKADAIRRKRQQALALADDFLRSAFLEMFGDPATNPKGFNMVPTHRVLSKDRPGTQSGPFGSALKKHEYVPAGIPVWGIDSVQPNRFIEKTSLFITEEKFQQLARYSVRPGDVLISRAGTVGRMCIAEPSVQYSIISTNLVRVCLDRSALLPEYFVSLFTYAGHRLGGLRSNQKENAFTFLNPETLKALQIPVPPLQVQKDFHRLVHRVHEACKSNAAGVIQAEELCGSLSQRAFSGQLVCR